MPRTKRKIRKSNNNFRSPQKAIINTRGERLKKENDKFSILLAESKNINVLDSGQNKTKTFFFFLVFLFNSKIAKFYTVEYRSIPEVGRQNILTL